MKATASGGGGSVHVNTCLRSLDKLQTHMEHLTFDMCAVSKCVRLFLSVTVCL